MPIGAVFIFLSTAVAFTVGALSNVYFWDEEGKLSIQAAGNVDTIIPLYINSAMPDPHRALHAHAAGSGHVDVERAVPHYGLGGRT